MTEPQSLLEAEIERLRTALDRIICEAGWDTEMVQRIAREALRDDPYSTETITLTQNETIRLREILRKHEQL